MVRGLKYLLYFVLGLMCLVVLSLITTQTRFFKNWLRDLVVEKANEALNGELSVSRIDGNFFTNLEVTDILLKSDGDTVLFLPRFRLEHSTLRILQNEIRVDTLLVDAPFLKLVQLPDSSWNVSHLAKTDTTSEQVASDPSAPFGYRLSLGDFHLRNASIQIAAADSLMPQRISDFNIRLNASYADLAQELHLSEFRLRTEQPNLQLEELTFALARNQQRTVLEDFVLRTARNRLDASATYFEDSEEKSRGRIQSQPIVFEEFGTFFPDLGLAASARFSVETQYQHDRLQVVVVVAERDRRILLLQGEVQDFSRAIENPSSAQVGYGLNGTISSLDLAHWLNDSTMAYILNGELELAGQGLAAENAVATLEASFPNCVFLDRPVEDITVLSNYTRGDLSANVDVFGNFGEIALDANAYGIADTQRYDLTLTLAQLNAAKLILDDSLQTNLNMRIAVAGQSFDPEKARGKLSAGLSRSTVMAATIDTLCADMAFTAEQFEIDTLHFGSAFLQLDAAGRLSLAAENDLRFRARVGDLMTLNDFIQADTLHASGGIEGRVTGPLDSLLAEATLAFQNILFNENAVDTLAGELTIRQSAAGASGETEIRILNAGTPALAIDRLALQSSFTPKTVDIVVDLAHQEEVRANLRTQVLLDSIPRVRIPKMDFEFKGQRWSGGSAETEIVLHPETYEVRNFRFASQTESAVDQLVSVDGTLSLAGEEDLRVRISGIDLGALATMLQSPTYVDGNFFLNLQLSGTADQPMISGNMAIREGKLGELAYETLYGWVNYDDQRLQWHFGFLANSEDSLAVDGYVPVNLALTNEGEVLDKKQALELRVRSDGLPLEVIRAAGIDVENVSGEIKCDIKVANTLEAPKPSGFLSLENGAVDLPDYGIDYQDFRMHLSLDSASVSLDSLQARREDGTLTATGFFAFDGSLVSGVIESTQFHLLADQFFLARHRDYEIQISGEAELSGDTETPRFGGGITILRSSFYLPAFTEESGGPAVADDPTLPMLVAATRDFPAEKDSLAYEDQTVSPPSEQAAPDLYKNLRGSFKVTIPKNTWLKSPDMRLEIAGDLDLVKNGPDLEIFGPIRVVRGHYDLRGRRFNFVEGLLTFEGGAEYNPILAMELEYVFRTAAREKKSLKLFVSGKALTPELKFTLDDTEITEGDALSYIMFGRSLDELTGGQKSSLAASEGKSEGSLVQGLAANLVADQLSKTLGNKLNLDFIEIKSQDSWQNATFVVGKYLTNDLFMSYERGFGESEDDEIQPEVITLEYELTRFLFLQLIDGNDKRSGYDVIFKFEH